MVVWNILAQFCSVDTVSALEKACGGTPLHQQELPRSLFQSFMLHSHVPENEVQDSVIHILRSLEGKMLREIPKVQNLLRIEKGSTHFLQEQVTLLTKTFRLQTYVRLQKLRQQVEQHSDLLVFVLLTVLVQWGCIEVPSIPQINTCKCPTCKSLGASNDHPNDVPHVLFYQALQKFDLKWGLMLEVLEIFSRKAVQIKSNKLQLLNGVRQNKVLEDQLRE